MQSATATVNERASLSRQLASLGDRIAMTDLDDAQLRSLADALAVLAETFAGEPRPPWWKRGPDHGAAYRSQSPFIGTENPRSFGMEIADTSDAKLYGVRGRVQLNHLFAGPPGAVHGGVLAGLFDEVVGSLARQVDRSAIVATATLQVRFRRPTPLETALVFDAVSERKSSQRLRATATCTADGAVTATAEALMILRKPKPRRTAEHRS